MEGETSAAVIALTLLAAASALYAFWMSVLRGRAQRNLMRWIREHHADRWEAVSRSGKWIHPVAMVEKLRRDGLGDDPEFMTRYIEGKRRARSQIVFVSIGFALVGLLLFGVRCAGWHW